MQSLESVFTQEIHNKYIVFNTLFSRLPYDKMTKIGQLLPFLFDSANEGLQQQETPIEIIDGFFDKYTQLKTEKERVDLLFRFITYIERQVVLFDSIEDATFEKLHPLNQAGSMVALYEKALAAGKLEDAKEKLRNFKIRLVFTAHPTQFYPNSVLRITEDLQQYIKANDINSIDTLLQQLGKTPFINDEKPTPIDEASSILWFFRHVYYHTIGAIHDKVVDTFFKTEVLLNPIVELGFWPGGDRDGNPNVTAEVTLQVANGLRTGLLKCYYDHFKEIRRRFTFKEMIPLLQKINNKIYTNMVGLKTDLRVEDLMTDLMVARRILVEKHGSMFLAEFDAFYNRVKLLGLHFASLDIRQDSSIHERTMQAVLDKAGTDAQPYTEWEHAKKVDFLLHFNPDFALTGFEDALVEDTFKTIETVGLIQTQNGEKACHRYIISNSDTSCAVLEVLAMFRWMKIPANIDVVPLFETIEGLDNAQASMAELYGLPDYKQHLAKRGQKQTIMLGFSDGTKDGGYIKANWEIYKAKEKLSAVSDNNGIKVVFFDGRGGPPARGGGKTNQFYMSQGPTIANNEIQLTIQGQTISSMYGSQPQAMYNFEQLLTAGVHNDLFIEEKSLLDSEERQMIDELAEIGGQKYLELKNHPKFVEYLENKSTLKYYGKTNIGSRPSKRTTGGKLKLSDLRAIPFVGSWSQLKQNVPGYYGFGSALQKKIDEGQLAKLQALYVSSLYFKTLIQNSVMALSKSNFALTSYMKNDPEYGAFWQMLFEEYEISKQNMLLVAKESKLMETDPVNKLSVDYREQIVLPLLAIQQYALMKIEQTDNEEQKAIFEKIVTRSLFGNINASRNSA